MKQTIINKIIPYVASVAIGMSTLINTVDRKANANPTITQYLLPSKPMIEKQKSELDIEKLLKIHEQLQKKDKCLSEIIVGNSAAIISFGLKDFYFQKLNFLKYNNAQFFKGLKLRPNENIILPLQTDELTTRFYASGKPKKVMEEIPSSILNKLATKYKAKGCFDEANKLYSKITLRSGESGQAKNVAIAKNNLIKDWLKKNKNKEDKLEAISLYNMTLDELLSNETIYDLHSEIRTKVDTRRLALKPKKPLYTGVNKDIKQSLVLGKCELYKELGELENLIKCYDVALKIKKDPWIMINKGKVYRKQGKIKKSKQSFVEALSFAISNHEPRVTYDANLLLTIGKYNFEEEHYEIARTYFKKVTSFMYYKTKYGRIANTHAGIASEKIGEYKIAIMYYKEAIRDLGWNTIEPVKAVEFAKKRLKILNKK